MNQNRLTGVHSSNVDVDQNAGRGLSNSDLLFAMLDGHAVHGPGGATWRLEVLAIHIHGRQAWLQVGPAWEPYCSVVLHVDDWTQVDQAVVALERWAATPPGLRPAIVDASTVATPWRQ